MDGAMGGSTVGVASGSKDTNIVHSVLGESGCLRALHTFTTAHAGVVKCVRWRRDGRACTLASVGNDKALAVWDMRSYKQALAVPDAHKLSTNTVAWSPCGRVVMTSAFDNTLKLWDVRNPAKELIAAATVTGKTTERANSIVHPAFLLQGRALMVPLPRQYSVLVLDAVTGAPLPVGEDIDGCLELLVEDEPVQTANMAVASSAGWSHQTHLAASREAPLLVATNNNKKSQRWEVMGSNSCA